MANEALAKRYATAVFSLAKDENAIEAVGRDLQGFVDALSADDAVRRFYRSPVVDRTAKEKVIAEGFGRMHPIALHTVLLLIKRRRETIVDDLVRTFEELEREARGARILTIHSARELGPTELASLVADLERRYGTRFDVVTKVEPGLIGGIRLFMGDREIDGTISGRLDDIARLLANR